MSRASFDKHIEIKVAPYQATMIIRSTIKQEITPLTKADVVSKLEDMRITHGIDAKMIEQVIAQKLYDKTHVIAKGTPVVDGKDAYIEEVVKLDASIKPKMRIDGRVDYKNLENLPQARQGDAILLKHARTEPQNGIDIYGNVQQGKPSVDLVTLVAGQNARVTDDGLKLYALTNGYIYKEEDGSVSVGGTFEVKGDVNVKSGNIHYIGDVIIHGDVADDFNVIVGGNLVIEGTVGACEISAGGNIEIQSGVFGRGTAKITSKKNITISMAREANIECGRTLRIERGLNNCKVITNELYANKEKCIVSGCAIVAYKTVDMAVVGSEQSQMHIRVVDRNTEAYEKKLAELDAILLECEENVERYQNQLMMLRVKHGKSADHNVQFDKDRLTKKMDEDKAKLKAAREERKAVVEAYIRPCAFPGRVVVREKVFEGVKLEMYRTERELDQSFVDKEITWKKLDGPEDEESLKQNIPKGQLVLAQAPQLPKEEEAPVAVPMESASSPA